MAAVSPGVAQAAVRPLGVHVTPKLCNIANLMIGRSFKGVRMHQGGQ